MTASGALRIGRADAGEETVVRADDLTDGLDGLLSGAEYVVFQPAAGALRPVLTRLHALDPALQIILAPERDRRPEVERALLFTPGVGEVWIADPDELGEALYRRAADVTRKRRAYRSTRSRVHRGLAALGATSTERALISDAFLAALLDVVPDPVLSLDGDGRVVSANPAAGRLVGRTSDELVGMSVEEVLGGQDHGELDDLLERGSEQPATGELRFRGSDGEQGIAEASVAPAVAGPHRVRCLVLHDVTAARRVQAELEQQAHILEEQAAELEEQAAEYEMVNQELQERTDELEEAMTARSRFYAGMSHELRTPLNAIIGYNSLLLDGVVGALPEELAQPLERAQRAAYHLLELVNDVLDLAKIEAGRIELSLETVYFPDVLNDLMDTIRPLAEDHATPLETSGPSERASVVTDARRVRQILLNLLSNAVKFGEGQPVRTEWKARDDGWVEISIHDRGRGIAIEHLDAIFDEFVQFESSGEHGGTGLGLTISRRLTDAIGGRLEAESALGEGSVFRLLVPPRPDVASDEDRTSPSAA